MDLETQKYGAVGKPERTSGGMDIIKSRKLDTKDTGGVIGQPTIADDGTTLIATKSAPTTNPDTDLNGTYDHANLSAKYKYPRVSEEIPDKGKNQYE